MQRLLDEALAALGSSDPDAIRGGILLAGSFFESGNGQRRGLIRPDVQGQPATGEDLARLQAALTALVRDAADEDTRSAAVFALSKCHDESLVPLFTDVLRQHVRGDAGLLYQAMIALDNLGRTVFGGAQEMSVLNAEENRELARTYLRSIGHDAER